MLPFRKMHGLGNDFVVLDARRRADLAPHPGRAPPRSPTATPASAATRSSSSNPWRTPVPRRRRLHAHPQPRRLGGRRLRQRHPLRRAARGRRDRPPARHRPHDQRRPARRGPAGRTLARRHGAGPPRLAGGAAGARDGHPAPAHLAAARSATRPPAPWATRTPPSSSPTSSRVRLDTFGPSLERDPLFPERANIGFAQVLAPDRLRLLRVGTRRRPDARLRLRRLRRAGERPPPRPAPAAAPP